MSRTSLIRYQDFTGGLNLRADAFTLGPTESADLMNIDVDPRGGFHTRKPWIDWQQVAEGGAWDPRILFSHIMSSGEEVLFLAEGGSVWTREEGGSFTDSAEPCTATPHMADFTSWKDDVFVSCGTANPGLRWNGVDSTFDQLYDPSVASGLANWTTDILSPVGDNMPRGSFTETHNGYLWVANTLEAGTAHPYRVRWSLPNDPDAWDELDYIDIPQGGGPITGIASYRDHLLIFFPKAVFAIYGSDRDTIQRLEITKAVGAVNRQCIAKSENAVYFVSWPEGVHRINGESVDEVSVSLRPAFDSPGFTQDTDEQWLAWTGQKLLWTVPFDEDAPPAAAKSTFVFDPSIEAWTMDRLADGSAVAPFVSSKQLGVPIGCHRTEKYVLQQGDYTTASDIIALTEYPFLAVYRSAWFHDGTTTIKKRWRRPDIVAQQVEVPTVLDVFVYHDFDEANAKRSKTLTIGGASAGIWYADPEWDGTDASLTTPPPGAPIWSETEDPAELSWGDKPSGSDILRLSSLGNARAIQLEFRGPLGAAWGINHITFKYILRRIR